MRVCLLCQYFPPEVGAPQARLSELASAWARSDCSVTVLTGMPNHPTGIVPPPYRRRLRVVEDADGYRIVRCWLYATPNERVMRKTLSHVSFMFSSVVLGWRKIGKQDVLIVSSPTFFSIFSGWFLARLKRVRLIVEVRDLWPGLLIELGVLKKGTLTRILEWLELRSYRAADEVVVVTHGFKEDLIARGVPPEKVAVMPNGVDLARFDDRKPADAGVRDLAGIDPDCALVLYIGAHGTSQGLASVLKAAELCRGRRVHFLFVGEGAEREKLVEMKDALGLENVTMRASVLSNEVPAYLSAADVCLVPLRDVPLFEKFIPSKMFEFLAAGKAVVGCVRGEAAAILERAGARVVAPEDPAALARAIAELADDPAARAAMGARGRAFVRENFDRHRIAAKYLELLEDVVSGERPRAAASGGSPRP